MALGPNVRFTGTHGMVSVISWETGQVVDFQIMTKRTHQKTVLGGDDSDEYVEWWERTKHKESCQINHFGSSPSMECAAAVEIWKRSEKNLYLRYTDVISDGDSKTVSSLGCYL